MRVIPHNYTIHKSNYGETPSHVWMDVGVCTYHATKQSPGKETGLLIIRASQLDRLYPGKRTIAAPVVALISSIAR